MGREERGECLLNEVGPARGEVAVVCVITVSIDDEELSDDALSQIVLEKARIFFGSALQILSEVGGEELALLEDKMSVHRPGEKAVKEIWGEALKSLAGREGRKDGGEDLNGGLGAEG